MFLMKRRGAVVAACALLLCAVVARAQSASAPPAPRAAPQTPARRPPQPGTRRVVAPSAAPRMPATAPTAPAAEQAPQARSAAPQRAVAPPRQVVTVVHRLSGWKLLTWLATSGPPALELEDLPSTDDVHTNIVAGYIWEDGRTVVARLPRAEVEVESFAAAPPPGLFASTADKQDDGHEYMIVTNDGTRVNAKFVGLDASTGLSLLEAAEPIIQGVPMGAEGNTEDPTVGERVRLYAPAPAAKSTTEASTAPEAAEGFIYLSIDQMEGTLTQVRRGPSGRLSTVVVRANVSPEWTGAVAADESGEVVGIVSQSISGETQIVPIETMRTARERVLRLGASAPQPWLGFRGYETFKAPLQTWVGLGWKPETALPHIQKRQGVFLTAVAPGTPAALAGLRAGDIIARVGARDVRTVEDLSFTLKEAGVGSTLDFTVLRAASMAPLKLSVQLKGAQNPELATAEAEERAARASLAALRREVEAVRTEEQSATDASALSQIYARMREAQLRMGKAQEQMEAAEARVAAARYRVAGDQAQAAGVYNAASPLQTFGLNAIGLNARGASRLGASGGLLVVAVRPDSPCAASGLRAGDVIETVNGSPFTRPDLRRLINGYEGTPISLGVVRQGQRLTISLALSGENDWHW